MVQVLGLSQHVLDRSAASIGILMAGLGLAAALTWSKIFAQDGSMLRFPLA